MPTWLKVVLAALLALGIVGGLAVLAFTFLFTSLVEAIFDPDPDPTAREGGGSTERVFFLQQPGFDPTADGAAVILHPLATGGDTVVITDPAILSAATETAFYTDNQTQEARLVLLSILFLSPPTTSTRSAYASLFQDGREVATLTCFRLHCQGEEAERDLAGLLSAGRPVVDEVETVTGLDAIRTREAALLSGPDIFVTNGAEQLPPLAERFPGYVWLSLPSVVAPVEDQTLYDPGPLEARLDTEVDGALRAAEIDAAIDRMTSGLQWSGYQLWQGERPTTDPDGYLVTDGYLPVATPSLRIWLTPEDVPRLATLRDTFDALGHPELPADATLAARIPSLLAERGIPGDPGEFQLRTEIYDFRTESEIGSFREPEVIFTYFRVAPE